MVRKSKNFIQLLLLFSETFYLGFKSLSLRMIFRLRFWLFFNLWLNVRLWVEAGDEWVINNIFDIDPDIWIRVKQVLDQILSILRHVIWKHELPLSDLEQRILHAWTFERWCACE